MLWRFMKTPRSGCMDDLPRGHQAADLADLFVIELADLDGGPGVEILEPGADPRRIRSRAARCSPCSASPPSG